MIKGMHAMYYTPKADEARAFVRDKLGFPCSDVGDGWLIFDVPEADLGFHPSEGETTHDISFYCEDIHATVAELKEKGVEFLAEVEDQGFGQVTYFAMPGGLKVMLYEPRYTKGGGA
ncbi:MAG: VOC family protein [Bradymonadaceae bacterium]|nr:VOC family protein [Lujinxingiaceae bacterium]